MNYLKKLIEIDLKNTTCSEKSYNRADELFSLLDKRIVEFINNKETILLLIPGLLTGTSMPTASRMNIFIINESKSYFKSISTPFAQKLASSDIGGLILKGQNEVGQLIIHIRESEINFFNERELLELDTGEKIDRIRDLTARDADVIGIGPLGEKGSPISGIFNTYPYGKDPVYSVSNFAKTDVFSNAGLSAIAISDYPNFDNPVAKPIEFNKVRNKIARYISASKITGQIFPEYGSKVLINLMEDRDYIDEYPERLDCSGYISDYLINYNCTQGCMIGCLNRHNKYENDIYSSPQTSEIYHYYKKNKLDFDRDEIKAIIKRLNELGCNPLEFHKKLFINYKNKTEGLNKNLIDEIINEIESNKSIPFDKLALDCDECFNYHKLDAGEINIPGISFVDDTEFYEKLDMFLVLMDYLGLCFFSTFAILESPDSLAMLEGLAKYKTDDKNIVNKMLESKVYKLFSENDRSKLKYVIMNYFKN